MEHTHDHTDTTGKRLLMTMLINFLIPVAQICGGIYAGSMALLSDAVHNLSDFTALIIAYAAHRIGKRGPTNRHSFGMGRMEVISAVVMIFAPWYWLDSILSLIIVAYIFWNCLSLLKESIHVLMNGTPAGLDLTAVKQTLEALPGVSGIHYLHAWMIGINSVAFTYPTAMDFMKILRKPAAK
ncbi:MAG: cation transporter [Desulfobacteraceae bacterium]|nr:cation transporter [Desulfobacteraceae bacterium]MBU4054554.1 cation transporter [Pseudomonadota bacterium]